MPRASKTCTCEVCGKVLNRKADLRRHARTHASNKEEMMLSCTWPGCTHKTLQKSNLVLHMHTHTGERPIRCPTIGCTFSTRAPASLTRHRVDTHGYVPQERSRNGNTNTESSPQGPAIEIHQTLRIVLPQMSAPSISSTGRSTMNGLRGDPTASHSHAAMAYQPTDFPVINTGTMSAPVFYNGLLPSFPPPPIASGNTFCPPVGMYANGYSHGLAAPLASGCDPLSPTRMYANRNDSSRADTLQRDAQFVADCLLIWWERKFGATGADNTASSDATSC